MGTMRPLIFRGPVALTGAAAVVVALAAVRPVTGEILQVTDLQPGNFVSLPSISQDATLLTFGTNANVGGLNASGFPNVFVYDASAGQFTRITADGGFDPTISGNGRFVAFTSFADYAHRNADGSDEIFRYDRVTKRFLQFTSDRNGDGSSELPVIDGDGHKVVFETTSNLRGRNSDFSPEVYLSNRGANSAMSRDPNGDGESHNPTISADGSFAVFESYSNLTGRNEDFSQELMIYDIKQHQLSQATNDPEGNGSSGTAAISGDGKFIAFISSSNVAGLNPDGASAVYLLNRARRDFSVITVTPDGVFDGDTPTINGDGRWIAFVAGFNVTHGNPDFNAEILLYDRIHKTFTQLTNSTGCFNVNPKISGDGTRVAFLSNCDYTGGNTDGTTEVFLADNPALNLAIDSEGPVGLTVTDPNGGVINPFSNTIPRATYAEGDFDGTGQPQDRVRIPQVPEGTYHIQALADVGTQSTDPLTLGIALGGLSVPMPATTVGAATGVDFTFGNQTFKTPAARMTPLGGIGSAAVLSTRLPHLPAESGPVIIRFSDGINELAFDLGGIESFIHTSSSRIFNGTASGFVIACHITKHLNGTTSFRLSAKHGNLSLFAGTADVSMTMIVQIGADADMYTWRFKRRLDGNLMLR